MSQTPEWKANRLRLLEAQKVARGQAKMKSFKPYPPQLQFFEMGARKRKPMAEMVREAVDDYLARSEVDLAAALEATFGKAPNRLASPDLIASRSEP